MQALLWQERADALQLRLATSDQEYSKLEARLTEGVSQLRQQHERELALLSDENVALRRKLDEVCEETATTKRQQHIMLECLKEVASSYRAIGGDEVEKLRSCVDEGQAHRLVHQALLNANMEDAHALSLCLDDLMAQACILQRHLDNTSHDMAESQQKQHTYYRMLQDTNSSLLSLVGLSLSTQDEQQNSDTAYEFMVTSIDACLASLRAQSQNMRYSVDEAEHRVESLEESFNALATVSKMRALTHNGLLERIHVISTQQHALVSLESKSLTCDNVRLQQQLDASAVSMGQLQWQLEMLGAKKCELEATVQSESAELARVQTSADEQGRRMLLLESEAKAFSVEREMMAAGD